MKLWYRGKEFLIKKVFHLTYKENIKKSKEVLRKPGNLSLPLQILLNCVPQNIPLARHRDSGKNDPELGKSDLTNFRNFVELLWHRVKGGDRNLENHVQNAHECLIFYCFSLDFDQNYQPVKITLQVSGLIIKYLVAVFWIV